MAGSFETVRVKREVGQGTSSGEHVSDSVHGGSVSVAQPHLYTYSNIPFGHELRLGHSISHNLSSPPLVYSLAASAVPETGGRPSAARACTSSKLSSYVILCRSFMFASSS